MTTSDPRDDETEEQDTNTPLFRRAVLGGLGAGSLLALSSPASAGGCGGGDSSTTDEHGSPRTKRFLETIKDDAPSDELDITIEFDNEPIEALIVEGWFAPGSGDTEMYARVDGIDTADYNYRYLSGTDNPFTDEENEWRLFTTGSSTRSVGQAYTSYTFTKRDSPLNPGGTNVPSVSGEPWGQRNARPLLHGTMGGGVSGTEFDQVRIWSNADGMAVLADVYGIISERLC
jgi:hypothetical protein